MKNQKGMITVDYLVAMVLVAGFSSLILALSLALTVVETVQYITFASARNYFAGNLNPSAQSSAAEAKLNQLLNNSAIKPLLRNSWFQINSDGAPTFGAVVVNGAPVREAFEDYADQPDNLNFFHGTSVSITLNALDINIPLFGPTAETAEDGKKKGFLTYIGSYLGRETTFEECENFMVNRAAAIKNLPSSGGARQFNTLNSSTTLYIPSDNGC